MAWFALTALVACGPPRVVEPMAAAPPTISATFAEDDTPKEDPRLVPAEAYLRTYLALFGALIPLDAQKRARGNDGGQVFDTWDDYFAALGFPDYRLDLPRSPQTNALMVATFERVGVALCDRAVEHDLKGATFADLAKAPEPAPKPAVAPATSPKAPAVLPTPPKNPPKPGPKAAPAIAKAPAFTPIGERIIFAFDAGDPANVAAFAPKFDVLHKTFLGYPARLASTPRVERFYALYTEIRKAHTSEKTRFTPAEAAWAAVCYGLIRHPEFHLY